ncbi:MAG: hypothetical protein JSV66_04810 [Trueperaceae bacterium]|nr:MAG: hypothetical protein JSV66_04810 [Trueperaceae bacterium]
MLIKPANPSKQGSDVATPLGAVDTGGFGAAIELYRGRFLDGFDTRGLRNAPRSGHAHACGHARL